MSYPGAIGAPLVAGVLRFSEPKEPSPKERLAKLLEKMFRAAAVLPPPVRFGPSSALSWSGVLRSDSRPSSGHHSVVLPVGGEPDDATVFSTDPQTSCRRDIAGVHSVFWLTLDEGLLCVANRLELLLGVLPHRPLPDRTTVRAYIHRQAQGSRSFVEGISQLTPATGLVVQGGKISIKSTWRPPRVDESLRQPRKAIGALRETLKATVESAQRGSHFTALELSGGLDSSSIVGISGIKAGTAGKAAVSAYFPHGGPDEDSFIAAVEEHTHLPVYRFDGNALDDRNLSRPILERPGGLLVTNFGVGEVELLQHLGADTLIVGFGGDQVTGDMEACVASPIHQRSVTAAAALLLGRGPRQKQRRTALLSATKWCATRGSFSRETLEEYRRSALSARVLRGTLPDAVSALSRMWADQGVHCRFPFLDRRMLDLMMSMPFEGFGATAFPRTLLRRSMFPFLPRQVRQRIGKAHFAETILHYRSALRAELSLASSLPTSIRGFLAQECRGVQTPSVRGNPSLIARWQSAWREIAAAHVNAWAFRLERQTPFLD